MAYVSGVDEFLEHFGVKGMHWGVKKDESSETTKPRFSDKQKKAAVVLGSAAAVTAVAAGVIFLNRRQSVPISTSTNSAKNFAESMAREPVGIMHSSRGRNRGYAFLRTGGLRNLDEEFANSGLASAADGHFSRQGSGSNERVVARFTDPEGRRDRAGRPIGHDVIIPGSMARDIHNIDDVVTVAWPQVRDIFGAYYESEQGTYGPGY